MVRELADETDEQLHVGVVVDRDFRSDEELSALSAAHGVHLLGCHEVENLFLRPDSLAVHLARVGSGDDPRTIVLQTADRFAGIWIADRASSAFAAQLPKAARTPLTAANWQQIILSWESLRETSAAEVESLRSYVSTI